MPWLGPGSREKRPCRPAPQGSGGAEGSGLGAGPWSGYARTHERGTQAAPYRRRHGRCAPGADAVHAAGRAGLYQQGTGLGCRDHAADGQRASGAVAGGRAGGGREDRAQRVSPAGGRPGGRHAGKPRPDGPAGPFAARAHGACRGRGQRALCALVLLPHRGPAGRGHLRGHDRAGARGRRSPADRCGAGLGRSAWADGDGAGACAGLPRLERAAAASQGAAGVVSDAKGAG